MIKALEIAQKLNQYNQTARRFYKDHYDKEIAYYRNLLEAVKTKDGLDTIEAVTKICNWEELEAKGFQQLMFLSAACDSINSEKP